MFIRIIRKTIDGRPRRPPSAAVAAPCPDCWRRAHRFVDRHADAPEVEQTNERPAPHRHRHTANPNFPRLHLTIWERASYNAGRFGAAFEHDGEVVDMGAQVLTVADPSHHNAGAGGTFRPCTLQHNSSTTAVLKACRLVRQCNVYAS